MATAAVPAPLHVCCQGCDLHLRLSRFELGGQTVPLPPQPLQLPQRQAQVCGQPLGSGLHLPGRLRSRVKQAEQVRRHANVRCDLSATCTHASTSYFTVHAACMHAPVSLPCQAPPQAAVLPRLATLGASRWLVPAPSACTTGAPAALPAGRCLLLLPLLPPLQGDSCAARRSCYRFHCCRQTADACPAPGTGAAAAPAAPAVRAVHAQRPGSRPVGKERWRRLKGQEH